MEEREKEGERCGSCRWSGRRQKNLQIAGGTRSGGPLGVLTLRKTTSERRKKEEERKEKEKKHPVTGANPPAADVTAEDDSSSGKTG